MASTYRFWALLGAMMTVAVGVTAFRQALQWSPAFGEVLRASGSQLATSMIMGNIAGIAVGLLLVRGNNMAGLIATVTTGVVVHGAAAWLSTDMAWWQICTTVFAGQAVTMSLAFAVPVLIAGGMANRLAYASALGVVMAFQVLNSPMSFFLSGLMVDLVGRDSGLVFGAMTLVVALILLLPVRGPLFDMSPPSRFGSLEPVVREGMTVAVLAALPWLALGAVMWLSATVPMPLNSVLNWSIAAAATTVVGLIASAHWIYRVNGEVASAYPTQKLFTPRAALLMYLLVPMATPILLLTLGGILREASRQRDGSAFRSVEWYNGWCVLFPPVAMGVAQEMLNDLGLSPREIALTELA